MIFRNVFLHLEYVTLRHVKNPVFSRDTYLCTCSESQSRLVEVESCSFSFTLSFASLFLKDLFVNLEFPFLKSGLQKLCLLLSFHFPSLSLCVYMYHCERVSVNRHITSASSTVFHPIPSFLNPY